MKKIVMVICAVLTTKTCLSQVFDWNKASDWKLYEISEDRALHYPMDTLKHFRSIPLNQDTMEFFLSKARAWPTEKYSMWMGLFVATCQLEDKQMRKVDISVYGGFFYDEATKRYYQIEKEFRSDWLDYLNNNYERFGLH